MIEGNENKKASKKDIEETTKLLHSIMNQENPGLFIVATYTDVTKGKKKGKKLSGSGGIINMTRSEVLTSIMSAFSITPDDLLMMASIGINFKK